MLLLELELEVLDDALVVAALFLLLVLQVADPRVFRLTQKLLVVFKGLNLNLSGFLKGGKLGLVLTGSLV